MPLLQGKYNHRKVYRPPGTRYAEHTERWPLAARPLHPANYLAVEVATRRAVEAFVKEFGRIPSFEHAVFEVACDSKGAHAVVYDLEGVTSDTDD